LLITFGIIKNLGYSASAQKKSYLRVKLKNEDMKLNQLKTTILITAISRLDLFVNLINNTNQIMNTTEISKKTGYLIIDNPTLYWILQIIITIAIFIIVYQIFKKIYEFKDELKIQLIIMNVRNFENFKEDYKNHEFYLLPNETMESYLSRSHQGIFQQKLSDEISFVRQECYRLMKDKKVSDIDNLVIKFYGLKNRKKSRN